MAGNVVLVKILKAGALKEMEIAVQERIESIKHKVKVFEKKTKRPFALPRGKIHSKSGLEIL